MSFIHPLVHVNWAYCIACAIGQHVGHVALDEEEGPCACSCAGGPAPARTALVEPPRELDYDDWHDDDWTEPDPQEVP